MSVFRSSEGFRRQRFAPERRLVLDTLRMGKRKPMMHGFVELDITHAQKILRAQRALSGHALSFTAFLLACLGRAVAANPEVHAVRDCLGRLVLFDDVDVSTMIEVELDGRAFALAHVIRGVNRRCVRDIHDEIRTVQSAGMRDVPGAVHKGMRWLVMLPGFLRRLVFRIFLLSPHRSRRHTGTLLVSSVGMFGGRVTGWGVSAPGVHNLSIVVGGFGSRPDAGGASLREHVCLTVSANHDIVDGAPLARFVRDLAGFMARAELLGEADADEPDSVP